MGIEGGFALYSGLPLFRPPLGPSQSVLIRGVASFQESKGVQVREGPICDTYPASNGREPSELRGGEGKEGGDHPIAAMGTGEVQSGQLDAALELGTQNNIIVKPPIEDKPPNKGQTSIQNNLRKGDSLSTKDKMLGPLGSTLGANTRICSGKERNHVPHTTYNIPQPLFLLCCLS